MKKSVLILISISCQITSFLCFYKGFFLSRSEINKQSIHYETPSIDFEVNSKSFTNYQDLNCEWSWKTKPYDKVILIIIDALRSDFIQYNSTLTYEETKHFQNKMPIFKYLVENEPKKTYLSSIYSDPPTTTLQRLKGITTGSFPTFIEFKDDFSSQMKILKTT